jgi:hypothetical protein
MNQIICWSDIIIQVSVVMTVEHGVVTSIDYISEVINPDGNKDGLSEDVIMSRAALWRRITNAMALTRCSRRARQNA